VHIQALVSADGILPDISFKLRLLVINLASVPADSWSIPHLHKASNVVRNPTTTNMQLRLLHLILLFISIQTHAQDSSNIVGRWRVVTMDNGVRYDYKSETYTVSQALKDSLHKHKTTFSSLKDYISWANSCRECYYVFKGDSTYQEFRETQLRSVGTFWIIPKDRTIKVLVKVGNKNVPKDYKYEFSKQRLMLEVPSFFRKEGIILELEHAD
jgi:hypothetical protein